jgi:hypothetical protein
MTPERAKLVEDSIAFHGLKSAREIGAGHGVSKNVVIGIWWRLKLPHVPLATRGKLIARAWKQRGGISNIYHRIIKPSSMPSQAKLALTPRSRPDWWSRKYLMDEAEV